MGLIIMDINVFYSTFTNVFFICVAFFTFFNVFLSRFYIYGRWQWCWLFEIWADTAKFTNVIVALVSAEIWSENEGKVFIKDKAKVASRVGCSERRVVNFRKLLLSPIRRNQI